MARSAINTRRLREAIPNLARGALLRLAEEILKDAQRNLVISGAVDTGRLLESGHIEEDVDGTIRVIFDAPYASYVEFGTHPHVIKAKPGHVLAFEGAGGTVFRREVHHPGTAANPFLRQAALKRRNLSR